MKTKFKEFTKAILFCLIIVLTSCEKDLNESLDPNNKTAPFKSKIVGLDDISNIKTFISQNFKTIDSKTARTSSGELTNAIFNDTSIIQTIDDNNNTNYSIHFVYDDTPENVFYNLIISRSPSGENSSHVLKYICNPSDFKNFMAHHFDFKYFVGVTELSSVNNIFASINKSSKQQSGDDECPKILLPSSSDGSSNNSGGGGDGGGNSTYSEFNTTVLGYNVSAGTSGVTSVTIGGTTYYAGGGTSSTSSGSGGSRGYYDYLYHFYRPSQATQKTTQTKIDCAQTTPSGYVPVNTNEATLTYLRTTLSLSKSQFMWLRINPEVPNEIFNYLYSLNNTPEAKEFVTQSLNEMINNSGLILDLEASFKSPFNIDKLTITDATPEGKIFNEIYKSLTESPEFKKLFLDIFDNSKRHNVKFEIAEHAYEDNDAKKKEVNATTSYDPVTKNLTIKISKQILIAGTTKSQTKIENAKTILHECIHAYLFIKANYPATGVDFVKILNSMYPNDKEQHDFMYDHMIPTMQKVLAEIRDSVTTQAGRSKAEERIMYTTLTPLTSTPWNWNDYYKYVSLKGLGETSCFILDFPKDSDQWNLLANYIKYGHDDLQP